MFFFCFSDVVSINMKQVLDAKCFASIAGSMNNEKEVEMNKYMTVGKPLKLSLI